MIDQNFILAAQSFMGGIFVTNRSNYSDFRDHFVIILSFRLENLEFNKLIWGNGSDFFPFHTPVWVACQRTQAALSLHEAPKQNCSNMHPRCALFASSARNNKKLTRKNKNLL
jgi:hypothetical protein